MEVIRIFHPVGQGGFYTESFDDNHMVVYDCGGNSKEDMQKYIDSFLPESPKQKIDAIFISHLHWDHINGLDYLIEKTKNIKHLFIPHLTKPRLFEIALYNYQFSDYDESQEPLSLIMPKSFYDIDIIEVLENREDGDNADNIVINGHSSIKSGEIIYVDRNEYPDWIYIPYCSSTKQPQFTSDNLQNEAIRELKRLYDEYNGEELYFLLVSGVLKKYSAMEIKKIYEILYGGVHNSQSMTVFSGLRIKDDKYFDIISQSNLLRNSCYNSYWHCHHGMCDCMCHPDCEKKIPCNFLYMGDFEAKSNKNFNSLESFYKQQNVWDTLCGIQIPHHGSRNNYNKGLYEDECFAVASAGIKNQFNHPHIDTLINIANQGCCPNVVTEEINTLKYQHFKIQ